MNRLHATLFASLALWAAPLAAQGSILPYLPKDTIMAFTAPDMAASMDRLAAMPIAKMWAEEEVQNFLADVKSMLNKQFEQGMAQAKEMHKQGALPVDPEQLMQLRMQGMTFALTHLGMSKGEDGPQPKLGIVMHMDFGASAPQWTALIQTGLGMLEAQAGPMMAKQESKVGEVSVLSYSATEAKGLDMGLNVAMVPGGMILGTLADDVRGIVDNMQKKTPVLGATAAYVANQKRVNASGSECEMFLRMDPMVDFGMNVLQMAAAEAGEEMAMVDVDGVERALKAMGWRNLGSMAAASRYVDGKCVTKQIHMFDGGTSTAAAAKTVDTSFLKWVPKDAVGFSAGTMDMMGLYDTLMKGLQAYDEQVAKQAMEQMAAAEQQLGFNVKDDFFGSFGDHYITWSMPMGTITSAPEMAVLVKVTNEEKMVKVLQNLAKLTEGMVEIEEGEKRGLKAYSVRINFDPTQGMGGSNPFDMISPTFAFKNGYMVMGFSASDVKRVFQRMDREDDPKNDIRGNKEFAAVAASLPKAPQSVSFTDWKAQFESFYQMATGLLAFVPMGEDVPIDMSLLPDSGSLTKHLFGSVSYTVGDANSSETTTVSPFGPEVTMLMMAGVVAGASAFGVMQTRGF